MIVYTQCSRWQRYISKAAMRARIEWNEMYATMVRCAIRLVYLHKWLLCVWCTQVVRPILPPSSVDSCVCGSQFIISLSIFECNAERSIALLHFNCQNSCLKKNCTYMEWFLRRCENEAKPFRAIDGVYRMGDVRYVRPYLIVFFRF